METLLQDIRYGLRMLRKNPGFTIVAALSLALGIGANVAIFSVLNAVLIRMLPVRAPERLVVLSANNLSFSYPLYRELRNHAQTLEGLVAFRTSSVGLSDEAGADRITAAIVSGNYFSVLGVQSALGSLITPEDDSKPQSGGPRGPVVVLNYSFWLRRFGADPAVLGKKLLLNGNPFTIVGVAAPGFAGTEVGSAPDVFAPMMLQSELMPELKNQLEARRSVWLRVMGRLKPKASVRQAEAELTVLLQQFNQEDAPRVADPERRRRLLSQTVTLLPGGTGISGLRKKFTESLMVLFAVVTAVLLIACSNVATLLLARCARRRHEIAIRLALGASRGRLMAQLLTESLILAILGCLIGLSFGRWARDLVLAFIPQLNALDVSIDSGVLAFTLLLAAGTAAFFGIMPAWQTTKPALVPELKHTSLAFGLQRCTMHKGFVAMQVALCLLLLTGAALFSRTLLNLQMLDPGFSREEVVLVPVDPRMSGGYTAERTRAFYEELLERIRALPGVRTASMADADPLGNHTGSDIFAEGYQPRGDEPSLSPGRSVITSDYFRTMGIPLLLGRDFDTRDRPASPKVAIINQTFARHYFGAESPLGKRLGQSRDRFDIEIVGVVKDSKYGGLREEPQRMVYLPSSQGVLFGGMVLHVKGSTDAGSLIGAIRKQVAELDRNVPIFNAHVLEDDIERSLTRERLVATLSGLFGMLALMLSAVGFYGVMAYAVGQRTREIGIRMALGATREKVLRSVLGEAAVLVIVGVCVGAPIAFAASRLTASMLYGVSPTDAISMASAVVLLGLVGLASAWIPARRASQVDPMVALRYE